MACTLERPTVKSGMCMDYPCQNGAECRDVNGTQFECVCRGGYTGEFCETMIDSCASSPCQNGGRCLAFAGGYTCACADKIIDECCCHGLKNPCPQTSMIIPGLNNYYPQPAFPDRYTHCDFDGRAFSRKCSAGLKWSQRSLSCLPDSFVLINPFKIKTAKVDLPIIEESVAEKLAVKPIKEAIIQAFEEAHGESKVTEEVIELTTMAPMEVEMTVQGTTMTPMVVEETTISNIKDQAEQRRHALMRKMQTKNLRYVTRPNYQSFTTGQ